MPDPAPVRPLVLVADPTAATAALIARQLAWAGYDTVTAASGAEALALLDARRPDAAVLEVMMGGVSGYEVVRRLREQPLNRLMPVIMISARAGQLDRDFAFQVGADEYVRKPFRCAELVARLAALAPAPQVPGAPIARRRPRRPATVPQPALAGR